MSEFYFSPCWDNMAIVVPNLPQKEWAGTLRNYFWIFRMLPSLPGARRQDISMEDLHFFYRLFGEITINHGRCSKTKKPRIWEYGASHHKCKNLGFALVHVLLITGHELVDATGGIDQFHLTGIERV